MVNNRKGSTTALIVVCAIIFCLFSFLYIYFYQTPTLTYEQHVLSGGVTVYHPLISAILITVVAQVLQIIVTSVTGLRGGSHALTYLPSMLGLAIITSGVPDGNGALLSPFWFWLILPLLVVYVCVIRIVQQWLNASSRAVSLVASGTLSINLFTLFVMMLFVCSMSNGSELFHRQVTAEQQLLRQDYATLAHEGKNRETTDTTLTLLRAIAMDKQHTLADSFFTQPVAAGTASLMRLENVRPLMVSKRFLMRRKSNDYRLCALLAGRDLDGFARLITKCCDVSKPNAKDSLPQHFREALVLYQHQRSHPLTHFSDSILEADYSDFRKLLATCPTPALRQHQLRLNYANTYWRYYYKKE